MDASNLACSKTKAYSLLLAFIQAWVEPLNVRRWGAQCQWGFVCPSRCGKTEQSFNEAWKQRRRRDFAACGIAPVFDIGIPA